MEGLSSKEATRRLAQYGKNVITRGKKRSVILLFLRQFADVMTLILLGCTGVSIFMGDEMEAFVMVGIVIANSILGFVQEFRTEKTIEALARKLERTRIYIDLKELPGNIVEKQEDLVAEIKSVKYDTEYYKEKYIITYCY